MDWDGIKKQILDDLPKYIAPEAVNEVIGDIQFRGAKKAASLTHDIAPDQAVRASEVLQEQKQFQLMVESCFYYTFKSALEVMNFDRPNVTMDIYSFGPGLASKLEKGLFVDFLLYALYTAQDWRGMGAEVEYLNGYPIYSRLLKAYKNNWILHESIIPEHIRGRVERPVDLIKVPKADQVQLEYFYGRTYKPPFPMHRKSQAHDEVRYAFPAVARCFDCQSSPDELWRNFFIRELLWGTNLAALMSQYNESFAPAPLRNTYSQIWNFCTSAPAIKQLMDIPSPAYRVSFMSGVLEHAFKPQELFSAVNDRNFSWIQFISRYDPNHQLMVVVPDMKDSSNKVPIKNAIPILNFSTLGLLVTVWAYMQHGVPALCTEDSLKKTFQNFLEDTETLSRFIAHLSQAVQQALEDHFDLPAAKDLSEVKNRWPLLLIPDHEGDHLKALMNNRDSVTSPADVNAEAFAAIQSICYKQS